MNLRIGLSQPRVARKNGLIKSILIADCADDAPVPFRNSLNIQPADWQKAVYELDPARRCTGRFFPLLKRPDPWTRKDLR